MALKLFSKKRKISKHNIKICIEAMLGRKPDNDEINYYDQMNFKNYSELGSYIRRFGSEEQKESYRPHRIQQSIFLGDRVLSYTHTGDRILLQPTDLDLTPSILEYGRWESHVEKAITQVVKPGAYAIEAGANIGYHTLVIGRCVGSNGIVHAFEANPAVMNLLRATMFQSGMSSFTGEGRVTLHEKAMMDRDDTLILQFVPNHFGSGHIITDNPNSEFGPAYSSKVNVQAVRADDFLSDLPHVDFIHLDIEGSEPLAILGAKDLISRSPDVNIIMEWSVPMMLTLGSPQEMVEWFIGQNFHFWSIKNDCTGFEPVSQSDLMSLAHCDVLISRQNPR